MASEFESLARRESPNRPAPSASGGLATVKLKYVRFGPAIFSRMLDNKLRGLEPGGLVQVLGPDGQPFGTGIANPAARVPVRVYHHGSETVGEEFLDTLVERSLALRKDLLALPDVTDAFRVINAEGDGLSGLIVDRFGGTLAIEVSTLGMHQRLARWLPHLHSALGTHAAVVSVSEENQHLENIPEPASPPKRREKIREHGVTFEVDFSAGHKTGFFCDQRENRRRFAGLTAGARVLDLCCYTGGFSVYAATTGNADEIIGVDLDETAVAQAQRNANLNQVPGKRIRFVHADAFSWARQAQKNGEAFDVVMLDPPKLVHSRSEEAFAEGEKKYHDLNQLAARLVSPGGWFVTCSCSGLLRAADFEAIVIRAIHRAGRRAQIIDRTGPGPDHPEYSNHPEGRYLKVIWCRLW
ncbi:MAG: class I SAM-dependent rRNA methyltransferase [Opitutales bacterium]